MSHETRITLIRKSKGLTQEKKRPQRDCSESSRQFK